VPFVLKREFVTFADAYAGHVKAFCTSGGAFCSAKRCTTDYLLGIRTLHRGSGSFPEAKRLELLQISGNTSKRSMRAATPKLPTPAEFSTRTTDA
jgi:hypothetical protein